MAVFGSVWMSVRCYNEQLSGNVLFSIIYCCHLRKKCTYTLT
jgi:hypothetical protein